jgi:hypothetical protein
MSDMDNVGFTLNVDGGNVQDLDYVEVCTTEQRDVDITKTHKEDEQGVPIKHQWMYRKGSRD